MFLGDYGRGPGAPQGSWGVLGDPGEVLEDSGGSWGILEGFWGVLRRSVWGKPRGFPYLLLGQAQKVAVAGSEADKAGGSGGAGRCECCEDSEVRGGI